MAHVLTPADPLPPWLQYLPSSTPYGDNTLYPLKLTKLELFQLWWNIKAIYFVDTEELPVASTETDLIWSSPLWSNRTDTHGINIDLFNIIRVSNEAYYPLINVSIFNGASGIGSNSSNSSTLYGTINCLGFGLLKMYQLFPDNPYSGSIHDLTIASTWDYSP